MPPPERNSDEAQLQTSRTTPLPFAAFCSKIGADTNTAITSTSGALSGFAATFAKQPIQRVKWIRQVGEGGSPIPYRTILKDTVQKLGFRGFFNGSVAAIYRNVPHSMISFTLYPKFERYVLVLQGGGGHSDSNGSCKVKRSFSTRFWAGYATLFVTTLITHPLDTMRVRLSVRTEASTTGRASFLTSAVHMYRAEGFSSFYRGFAATLVGAGPRGALGFGVFETLKPLLAKVPACRDNPTVSKFTCGYVAGLASEFFIYPLDTVRRRQQALGDSSTIGKRHVGAAVRHIWATEGIRGMYRGITLNLFKNPLAIGVSFVVNDLVKEHLGYSGPGSSHRSGE